MRALIPLLLLGVADARIVDRVVAVVNDEVVTQSELEELLAPMMRQLEQIPDPVARAQAREKQMQRGLDEMIGQKLVIQEGARRKLTVSVDEVDARIKQIRSQQSWDKAKLEQYLASQGMNLAEFRKQVREQLLRQRVVRSAVGSRVRISDRDLKDYYKEKVTQATTNVELEAAHILLSLPADSDAATEAATRQQATELARRAQAGEDFAALAAQYSTGPNAQTGGSLGTIRKGDLDPVLEEALFQLKEGGVGGPVRTRFGYHVVRANKRKALPPPPFEALEAELRRELMDRRLGDELGKWIEELKKKAFIEIRL